MVTPAQLRALQIGFRELGYSHHDRAERLAAATDVLGLEEPLSSFADLQFGQAGYLLGWLRRGAWDGPAREDRAATRPCTETGHAETDSGAGPEPATRRLDPAAAVGARVAGLAVSAAVVLPWLRREVSVLVRELVLSAAVASGPGADSIAGSSSSPE